MAKHDPIPHPTNDEKKSMEIGFLNSFGKTYGKMRKEELALMVVRASTNYKKMHRQATGVAQIGLAMKRQRDYYLKLIRSKR